MPEVRSFPAGARTIAVFQGAPGGIGRVEALLQRAWPAWRETPEPAVLTRRSRPAAGFAWEAARTVAHHRPRLLILGHLNFAPLALAAVASPATRVCALAYGIDAWRSPSPLGAFGLRRVDEVWSISQYTARALTRHAGYPAEKVRVLPLSLSPEVECELNAIPVQLASGDHLLTVTRLEHSDRYKGVDVVLQAMPAILRRRPGARLTIVGRGSDAPRLEALAEELGVGGATRFAGFVPDPQLASLYAQANVFVLPSEGEGFGLVFLEAMLAGLPVVAADSAATPEVVLDGTTGVLVEPRNPAALASAVCAVLDDRARAFQMGVEARDRYWAAFSYDRFRDRLASLMHSPASR